VLTSGIDGSQPPGNNSLSLGISLASDESIQGGGSGTTLILGGTINNQGNTLTVGFFAWRFFAWRAGHGLHK
jgi:hypothetical protein